MLRKISRNLVFSRNLTVSKAIKEKVNYTFLGAPNFRRGGIFPRGIFSGEGENLL